MLDFQRLLQSHVLKEMQKYDINMTFLWHAYHINYTRAVILQLKSALRLLGYNVADIAETYEHLLDVWMRYIEGKCKIDEVVNEYEKLGYHMNNDR